MLGTGGHTHVTRASVEPEQSAGTVAAHVKVELRGFGSATGEGTPPPQGPYSRQCSFAAHVAVPHVMPFAGDGGCAVDADEAVGATGGGVPGSHAKKRRARISTERIRTDPSVSTRAIEARPEAVTLSRSDAALTGGSVAPAARGTRARAPRC